ncbi:MAG TPA: hypothetical protein H9878_12275 [Candidatus Dietzia merdigallinarum]|nr:hypothetical protein [Candidatus Dietzia merdigallinarum]
MDGLTFTFTGPGHQFVAAVDGVVVMMTDSPLLPMDLEDAATQAWPITPTGPFWLGGEGITDAASVFWAMKYGMGLRWVHSGDVPEVPEIPPPEPGVIY